MKIAAYLSPVGKVVHRGCVTWDTQGQPVYEGETIPFYKLAEETVTFQNEIVCCSCGSSVANVRGG